MTKLMLIRHGQSTANLENKFAGHTNSALSDLGKKQAEMTANYIKENFEVDKVYASDLARAFETGKAVADKFGLEVTGDEALREIYGGEWEGILFNDLVEKYSESFKIWLTDLGNATCPGGESVAELQRRVVGAIKKIGEENEGKTVVIATHATPVRVLQAYCMGKDTSEMKNIDWVSNASVTFATYENGEITLVRAGYDKHLGEIKTELPDNV